MYRKDTKFTWGTKDKDIFVFFLDLFLILYFFFSFFCVYIKNADTYGS